MLPGFGAQPCGGVPLQGFPTCPRRLTPQNLKTIGWGVRRQKVRNGVCVPSWTGKKLDRPFRQTFGSDVLPDPRLTFLKVFTLQHKGDNLFPGVQLVRNSLRFVVVRMRREAVVSVGVMGPHAVLEHFVPDHAAAGVRPGSVRADHRGVQN